MGDAVRSFLFGFAPPEAVKRLSREASHGLLCKPVNGDVLVAAIRVRLGGARRRGARTGAGTGMRPAEFAETTTETGRVG